MLWPGEMKLTETQAIKAEDKVASGWPLKYKQNFGK